MFYIYIALGLCRIQRLGQKGRSMSNITVTPLRIMLDQTSIASPLTPKAESLEIGSRTPTRGGPTNDSNAHSRLFSSYSHIPSGNVFKG